MARFVGLVLLLFFSYASIASAYVPNMYQPRFGDTAVLVSLQGACTAYLVSFRSSYPNRQITQTNCEAGSRPTLYFTVTAPASEGGGYDNSISVGSLMCNNFQAPNGGLCTDVQDKCQPKINQTASFNNNTPAPSSCLGGCEILVDDGSCGTGSTGLQVCFYTGHYTGISCTGTVVPQILGGSADATAAAVAAAASARNDAAAALAQAAQQTAAAAAAQAALDAKNLAAATAAQAVAAQAATAAAAAQAQASKANDKASASAAAALAGTGSQAQADADKLSASSSVDTANTAAGASAAATTAANSIKAETPDFCKLHSESLICKIPNLSKGTCNQGTLFGFSCQNDPIQCAMVREQLTRNCELVNNKTDLSDIGESIANKNDPNSDSDPTKSSNQNHINVQSTLNSDAHFGGQLSDETVSIGQFGSIQIPFSKLNFILSVAGNILLAFSYFSAARIVGVN